MATAELRELLEQLAGDRPQADGGVAAPSPVSRKYRAMYEEDDETVLKFLVDRGVLTSEEAGIMARSVDYADTAASASRNDSGSVGGVVPG